MLKPERTADAQGVAQPVHLVFGVGQAERAAAMPGDRLAGFRLELPGVEADVVVDAFAEAEAGGRVGDLSGRMPGRAGGELGLFQQHHVRPALMGQVVGQAAAP